MNRPIRSLGFACTGGITAKRLQEGRWIARLVGTSLAWKGSTSFEAASQARTYQITHHPKQ